MLNLISLGCRTAVLHTRNPSYIFPTPGSPMAPIQNRPPYYTILHRPTVFYLPHFPPKKPNPLIYISLLKKIEKYRYTVGCVGAVVRYFTVLLIHRQIIRRRTGPEAETSIQHPGQSERSHRPGAETRKPVPGR